MIADLERKQEKCLERILTPLVDGEEEADGTVEGKLLREAITLEWVLVGIKVHMMSYRNLLSVAAQFTSQQQVPVGYDHESLRKARRHSPQALKI